jgi:protein TonB
MSGPEEQPQPAVAENSAGSPAEGLPPLPAIDMAGTFGMSRALQQRNWVLSVSAAVLAHLFVLFALWPRLSDTTGVGGGGDLTGIEVDIVSIAAIQDATTRGVGTGAEVAIFGGAGNVTSVTDQALKDDSQDHRHDTGADEPDPQTAEPTLLPTPERREAEPSSAAAEPTELMTAGGAAAPGAPSAAIVLGDGEGLSPGVVQKYKGEVVQRLETRKPSIGIHLPGEVVIEFTITSSGEVGDARVATSSGHKMLDEAALSAVQTTHFPSPPRGMHPSLLTYRVPYYFRPPRKR